MTDESINLLRVLVFEEDGILVAQCLEKDIGAQGKDMEEVFDRLNATICLETPYMERISKAPQKYFDMWEKGESIPSDNAPLNARRCAA